MRHGLAIVILLALSLAVGVAGETEDYYRQATNNFKTAVFLKPTQTNTADLLVGMAPLLIQETTNATQPAGGFGTIVAQGGGLALDPGKPTIYGEADTLRLKGQEHHRFTYVWFYSLEGERAQVQGVRITADRQGFPVMWEVLEPSSVRLVFAAESLEQAAEKEFGKPEKGRRFALEPKGGKPEVVIPRILDDGPVPMGPMIYLRAGTHGVASVACRCMKPQALSLLSASEYHVEPLSAGLKAQLLQQLSPKSVLARFWAKDGKSKESLGLRLPKGF